MADVTRKSFDESKRYSKVIWLRGKPLSDSDWNEGQDIQRLFLYRLIERFIGIGVTNENHYKVIPSTNTNSVTISIPQWSYILAKGLLLRYNQDIEVILDANPSDGTQQDIYLVVEEVEVDANSDPNLLNFGTETAARRQYAVSSYWSLVANPPTDTQWKKYIHLARITRDSTTEITDIIQASQIVDSRYHLKTLQELRTALDDITSVAGDLVSHTADENAHHNKIHNHTTDTEGGALLVTRQNLSNIGYRRDNNATDRVNVEKLIGMHDNINNLDAMYCVEYGSSGITMRRISLDPDSDKATMIVSGPYYSSTDRGIVVDMCTDGNTLMVAFEQSGAIKVAQFDADLGTLIAVQPALNGSNYERPRISTNGVYYYVTAFETVSNEIHMYAFTVSGSGLVDAGGTGPGAPEVIATGLSGITDSDLQNQNDSATGKAWILYTSRSASPNKLLARRGKVNDANTAIEWEDISPIEVYSGSIASALGFPVLDFYINKATGKKVIGLINDTTYNLRIMDITGLGGTGSIPEQTISARAYKSDIHGFGLVITDTNIIVGCFYGGFQTTPDIQGYKAIFYSVVNISGISEPVIKIDYNIISTLRLPRVGYLKSNANDINIGISIPRYNSNILYKNYSEELFKIINNSGTQLDEGRVSGFLV